MRELPDLQVYLGGGALRCMVLGEDRGVKDFDLFFNGPSVDRCFQLLGRAGRLDRSPYGAPRWFPSPEGSASADLIPVRRFVNGFWPCKTMLDVLNQVDCTLNAMALDLRTGTFYDPQNGRRDAAARIMRGVRFDPRCEPLRKRIGVSPATALWLRLVHYASVLNLTIEPVTLRWLLANRPSAAESRRFAEIFFAPGLNGFA
jgi:tRNA nucleotidyltransferase/poly(A) polymerase